MLCYFYSADRYDSSDTQFFICFALPLSETNIFFYLRICVAAIFFVGLKCSFIGTNLGSMQLCDHFYYIFSQRRNDQKTEL